jgi:hypothetical protein
MAVGGMRTTRSVKRIDSRQELAELARWLRLRPDWHDPDEQEVDAVVLGRSFDNAGFWGEDNVDSQYTGVGKDSEEMYVIIRKDRTPVAEVNLATLLSWAAEE